MLVCGSSVTGFEVAVADEEVDLGSVHTFFSEVPGEVFDDGDGAVAPTCTAYAKGEIRLAFGSVAGNEESKEVAQTGEEFLCVRRGRARRSGRACRSR